MLSNVLTGSAETSHQASSILCHVCSPLILCSSASFADLRRFEQALHENIRLVVETFPPGPTRDRLAKVATTFRIPWAFPPPSFPPIRIPRLTCGRYWDWALNESPHQILAQKTVEVTKPAGKVQIPNPLYSYRFSNLDVFKGQGLGPEFETWLQTVRYPTSLNDPHAESSAEFVTVVQASFNRLQQSQAGHWLK